MTAWRGLIVGLFVLLPTALRGQSIQRVADISPGPGSGGASYLTVYNDNLYYRANASPTGSDAELWRWDGVTASLAADINPGPTGSSPAFLAVYQGQLYFNARGPSGPPRLYRFDGAAATPVPGAAAQNPEDLLVFNNTLFYRATNFATVGMELWKFDGSTQTALDLWPGPGSSGPKEFVQHNGQLYFNAVNQELWRLNATATGATQVTNIAAGNGSSPESPAVFNGAIYFSANDRVSGRELWRFDGATSQLAADIQPGDSSASGNPWGLTPYRGGLYFSAESVVDGVELWRYDGTQAQQVANINARPQLPGVDPVHHSSPSGFHVFNDVLYFSADDGVHGRELWSYDGANLRMVADLYPGPYGSEPSDFTEFRGRLLFQANDGQTGGELTELGEGLFQMSPPPPRERIAYSQFDEPAIGADSYTPSSGAEELGFHTTASPAGANPMASVVDTSTTPTTPILSHRSIVGNTTFDAVDLTNWDDVIASIELQVRATTYEDNDFVRVYVTDGVAEFDLVNLSTAAALNDLAGNGYLTFSTPVPDAWTQATLIIASSSNSTAAAERFDFDAVEWLGRLSPGLVGDLNSDGVVDAADAALLAQHFGMSGAVASDGDMNSDGLVSLADLAALQIRLGSTSPSGSAAAVPEPAAWLLACLATACAGLGRKRRFSGR